jgi:hypothetical protein
MPGADERFSILKRYGLPYAFTDEDLDVLVDATAGASPALLRGLMEGCKRQLIVRPKMGMPIDDPVRVFTPILSSLQPPTGMAIPPLWKGDAGMEVLRNLAWPPERPVPPKKEEAA